jgi:guanylate kinase
VISGPSGVGKGTLIDMLVKYYNKQNVVNSSKDSDTGSGGGRMDNHSQDLDLHYPLGFSVSHTTRNPRPGEINGIHYHFTTRDEMWKAIDNNEFIEYAQVHGNIYGTSYESVERVIQQGKICILDIDIQGAMKMKKESEMTILPPHYIFIAPPSMEVLETRLRDRGTETEDAMRIRLENAKEEVGYGLQPGNFDEVVVNDDLNESFMHLRMILEKWYPHLNQVLSPSYDL